MTAFLLSLTPLAITVKQSMGLDNGLRAALMSVRLPAWVPAMDTAIMGEVNFMVGDFQLDCALNKRVMRIL